MTQSPQQNINVVRRRTLRCTLLYTVLLQGMEPRTRGWCVSVYVHVHISACVPILNSPYNLTTLFPSSPPTPLPLFSSSLLPSFL